MPANVRFQKPVKGGRLKISAAGVKELRRAVDLEARKFRVSRSFVVVTALADALGIDIEKYYETQDKPQRAKLFRVK